MEPDALTEHVSVPDIFVSGLARIEDVGGGNLRFTFYAYQESVIFSDRRREKVVVARLIMPASEVGKAAQAAQMAASGLAGVVNAIPIDQRH